MVGREQGDHGWKKAVSARIGAGAVLHWIDSFEGLAFVPVIIEILQSILKNDADTPLAVNRSVLQIVSGKMKCLRSRLDM